jgi:hypothetical protein
LWRHILTMPACFPPWEPSSSSGLPSSTTSRALLQDCACGRMARHVEGWQVGKNGCNIHAKRRGAP